MTPRVAAVIPALDEEGAIGAVLAAMPRELIDRVIVVDGGSRDRTTAVAAAAGAEVIIEPRRGYGRACATGAEAAIAGGAEIVLFLDGDGGDRPEAIPRLLQPIRDGSCDFAIGSRTRGGAEPGSIGLHQIVAGRVLGLMIGLVCGVRYSDMCALRAIRAKALAGLGMRETSYGWNLEMQMRAARAGLRVLELPVPYGRRLAGRSKVAGTWRGSLKAAARILATFAHIACERRGRSRPDPGVPEQPPPSR